MTEENERAKEYIAQLEFRFVRQEEVMTYEVGKLIILVGLIGHDEV